MSDSTEIRAGRHVVHMMPVHWVFVAKYRKCVFSKPMLAYLKDIFSKVSLDFEATLEAFEGEADHVHPLIAYPPKLSISKWVNSLKGVSARMLRKDFSEEISKCLWGDVLWSPSYFAGSCGGAPLSVIKKYIPNKPQTAWFNF